MESDHLGYPGVERKIILGWIFNKWVVGLRTGSICLGIGAVGGRL